MRIVSAVRVVTALCPATLLAATLLAAALTVASAAQSTAPVAPKKAPSGSTGLCKDGTYTTAGSKRGACSGHKGLQTWYSETRAMKNQQTSGGTNPPKDTPSTTPAAASPEPIASPAPKQ